MNEKRKQTPESCADISALCRELALLLHAGAGVGDGLSMLAAEEPRRDRRAMLLGLADALDCGMPLSEALAETRRYGLHAERLSAVVELDGRRISRLLVGPPPAPAPDAGTEDEQERAPSA